MISISIIIPTGGDLFDSRLKSVMQSIDFINSGDLEIIVSRLGSKSTVERIPTFINARQIITEYPANLPFNCALARNLGAKAASCNRLYFSDADILFFEKDYFKKNVVLSSEEVLRRPIMRRMCKFDVDIFLDRLDKMPFSKVLMSIDLSKPYLAALSNRAEVKVFSKPNNDGEATIFLSAIDDFNEFIRLGKPKGTEPIYWTMNRHYSGGCISKSLFEFVGGFCTDYVGWGCEDDDFNFKIQHFSKSSDLTGEVIHLDHLRSTFDKNRWESNKTRLESRKKQNIEMVLNYDRTNYQNL
jgi:predicted glycosyltransferase involved in capsule biosynthesis